MVDFHAQLADLHSLGLSAERLQSLDTAVRSGEYQAITSILLARGDRLAFESYYQDAGLDTLHNTRSATKTVTGMLVGIAINRDLLPGVFCTRAAFFMEGTGGSKVLVFPRLDLVAMLTSQNFGVRTAHQFTDHLVTDYLLTAVRDLGRVMFGSREPLGYSER